MIVDKETRKLFSQLLLSDEVMIECCGRFSVRITTCSGEDAVVLSVTVYLGGNYIPKSVRQCLKAKAPFYSFLVNTSLVVDEGSFRIDLIYKDLTEKVFGEGFTVLLEEFCALAEKWRDYLDEHDQNDLVHVPVK